MRIANSLDNYIIVVIKQRERRKIAGLPQQPFYKTPFFLWITEAYTLQHHPMKLGRSLE